MVEAIAVADLRKSYGDVQAVAGVSLVVEQGEIFGMVGPNGAGKTTTIECIEGLRKPDGGSVTVLGLAEPGVPTQGADRGPAAGKRARRSDQGLGGDGPLLLLL
jgi:ABC-type branched-subunit amino acid transport system ATPase component